WKPALPNARAFQRFQPMNDLRFAVRQLLKAPGFAIVAVLTLAVAIGMNTAIFSVVHALLVDPFPYRDHSRIVQLRQQKPHVDGAVQTQHTGREFAAYQEQARSFEALAAMENVSRNLTVGNVQPERAAGSKVTADFFTILGVPPQLGRTLSRDEQGSGATRVVVLGYDIWQSRFGGDPRAVGRTVELDAEPYTIVGVMPARFRYAGGSFWFPFPFEMREAPQRWYGVIGRLAPGASLETANAELATIAARFAQTEASAADYADWTVSALSLRDGLLGNVRTAVFVLMGAVVIVLLIACANVAGLLLVRASTRQREIAIRAAIGATRAQLLRQFFVESAVLAAVGGAFGMLIAAWGVDGLLKLLPEAGLLDGGIPAETTIHVSSPVLLFAVCATFATTFLFGLWPAWQASRTDAGLALRLGDRSGSSARQSMRSVLIVAEVGLAVVMLAGAGLLLRSFAQLLSTEPGFRTERVLTMRLNLPPMRYDKPGATANFAEQLIADVATLPGVQSVAAVSHPPFSYTDRWPIAVEGRTAPEQRMSADNRIVSENYYAVMGIPLLHGRTFTPQDSAGRPGVVVINQAMARRMWGDEDPIGEGIIVYVAGRELPVTVVGVVADSRQMNLEQPAAPEMNFPIAQAANFLRRFNLAVRTQTEPTSLVPAIRAKVWNLDPQLPLYNVTTMETAVQESVSVRRFALYVLGLFASVALLLAVTGIYGLIGHAVAQRTREIGIRIALGAAREDVLRLILSEGGKLACAGVALGLVASYLMTQFLRALLYGVTPTDPLTFAIVVVVLLATALLACWLPARRATKVDPVIALRAE
ncbi:MAG: ABC transporter permease, partial [Chthoniobacterales bacterium]|nr:ABC transporter permease [Chthoniobacterales bacterium]